MRVESLLLLMLIAGVFACTYDPQAEPAWGTATDQATHMEESATIADLDIYHADIVQRTCALEVVLRPIAREDLAFGDINVPLAPLNTGPIGTMLACIAAPSAVGDTANVGVPWQ